MTPGQCHRGYGRIEPVKCIKGNRCKARYLITRLTEQVRDGEDFVTATDYAVLTKRLYCNNEDNSENCPIFDQIGGDNDGDDEDSGERGQ